MFKIIEKIISVFLIILLIVLIAISSYFLFHDIREENREIKIFNELEENINDDISNKKYKKINTINKKNTNKDIDIKKLKEKNSDVVAWIRINGTKMNYPVMQRKNNQNYYLRRNFYGNYSICGTPFLQAQCDIENSTNSIIYGHHMKNSNMFGVLEKYKNIDFYTKHCIIEIYTENGLKEYMIFAVLKTKLYSKNTFEYYKKINLNNDSSYREYIDYCKKHSFYDTGITPKNNSKIITLSTCEYSAKDSRLLVVAVEV